MAKQYLGIQNNIYNPDTSIYISGTSENDRLYGASGDDRLDGLAGNDILSGGKGSDLLYGDEGNDKLYGGSGKLDQLIGGEGDDRLFGNGGDDLLVGEAGNDFLDGGFDNDWLDGGSGNDFMRGGMGSDQYVVDSIGDIIEDTPDNIDAGVDSVRSYVSYSLGSGLENLWLVTDDDINGTGNQSDNEMTGGAGDNILIGGKGDDRFFGNGGNDLLFGEEGDDVLWGLSGAYMEGGAGDDTYMLYAGGGEIVERAGEGVDTVIYIGGSDNLYTVEGFSLVNTHIENLTLEGFDGTVTGNSSANIIKGDWNPNVIKGGAGSDTLYGDGFFSDDTKASVGNQLFGGKGDDYLSAGNLGNHMTGGAGSDIFSLYFIFNDENFDHINDGNYESTVISDFTHSEDIIDLTNLELHQVQTIDFNFIGEQAFSTTDATYQLRFDVNTQQLQGSINANTEAEFVITLTGVDTLSAADLML